MAVADTTVSQEFERLIIVLYDSGVLTPQRLDKVVAAYKEEVSDDRMFLWIETEDGKMIDQVVVETYDPTFVPAIERTRDLPDADEIAGEKGREMWYEEFVKVCKERWQWVA